MQARIAVVGGCNVDISATSATSLIFQDSNPGNVKIALGGVGRNIGENLLRLGHQVQLLAPLGRDRFYQQILDQSDEIGMDLSQCLVLDDRSTSTYICINHPNGDIALAVSAMDILDELTPAWLETKLDLLNQADYVVVDSNLTEDALHFLAENCTSPLCADAVSSKKAEKLRCILPSLHFLKVNQIEAEVLTGMPLGDQYSVRKASTLLHSMGVKNVAITLGNNGAFFSTQSAKFALPPYFFNTVNSTGCGDAFFAGALHGLINEKTALETLRYGLGMASICAGSELAVSPEVSVQQLENTLNMRRGDLMI